VKLSAWQDQIRVWVLKFVANMFANAMKVIAISAVAAAIL